jgi:rod shape determining protein RodA
MSSKSLLFKVDKPLLFTYLAMLIIGWVSIYAAVYDPAHGTIIDVDRNYGKQLVWILTALLIGMSILFLDPKFFFNFSTVFYLVTTGLLVIVLVVGRVIAGNKGWIDIGSFKLQPAEFAKFATALILARFLGSSGVRMASFRSKIYALCIVFLPMMLVLLQGDAGSALTFFAFILVLYREGFPGEILMLGLISIAVFVLTLLMQQYVLIGSLIGLSLIFIFYARKNIQRIKVIILFALYSIMLVFAVEFLFQNVLKPHQQSRINNLIGIEEDLKGAGYNVNQSKIAIGSGGFWGKGFLQGTQTRFDFVPEQSTDFIFCTIGEEYGFWGSVLVIGLMIYIIVRIINLSENQKSIFSRVYGYSVAAVLFFHFMINIGMTIGIMPVIGIPLPFVSYGGSSLWGFTILLFIFLRLDANKNVIIR